MMKMKKIASSKCCSRKASANQVLPVQVIAESAALSMGFMSAPDRSLLLRYVCSEKLSTSRNPSLQVASYLFFLVRRLFLCSS